MSARPPDEEGDPTLVEPAAADTHRGSFLVAAGILLSRLAGLLREVAVSAYLGVGVGADAFRAALRIPNLLQNLLGEGVLSASFIPVYARLLDEDRRKAGRVAGAVAGLLCAASAVLVVAGMLLARPLTLVFTPGFEGERLDLAEDLLRIMFPGIGFLVLSAWCLGILNSHRQFFLAYVAPVLWNFAQIVVVVAVAVVGASEAGIATALAWGVVAGGLLQLLVQVPSVRRLTPGLRLSLDRSMREVQEVLRRFSPVVVGRGVIQLLTYLELVLASLLAVGAVSALAYAQVLYLLPISLFGMAVAAAELPELARLGRAGRARIRQRMAEGMARVSFYVAPTVAVYVLAGDVVVRVLLERGEFRAEDTRLVWLTLAGFSLGLLATTRSRLLQNGLYALDRTKLVARIAVARGIVAVLVGGLLMFPLDRLGLEGSSIIRDGDLGLGPLPSSVAALPRLGVLGLAIGSAVASWFEYAVLRGALQWRVGRLPGPSLGERWTLLAALAAGVLAAGIRANVESLPSVVGAALVLGPALATYLLITATMRVPEADALLARARRLARR